MCFVYELIFLVFWGKMPRISSFSKYLILYSSKIYIFEPAASSEAVSYVDALAHVTNKPRENSHSVVDALRSSPCGQYLAATVGKELILFSFPECRPLSNATIEKTASSLRFFHKRKILLVADRSGLVTFLNYSDGYLQKENVILGHNSMLTDALISPRDDFVVTAERDEKIRVSCYPNVYNIQSFCLGHEMFVSSVCIVPTDHRLLISSSGDRTLRIWDYVNGTELTKYEVDANEGEGAIIKIMCRVLDGETQVAVQRYKASDIVLLAIAGGLSSGFQITMKEKIPTGGKVLDMTFCNTVLLYLVQDQDDMLRVWPEATMDSIKKISKYMTTEILLTDVDSHDVLFKRSFDNVQEYHERKKTRLS